MLAASFGLETWDSPCNELLCPSSPVSCKKLQFLFWQTSPRRKAEQYLVVPNCARSMRSLFIVPSTV